VEDPIVAHPHLRATTTAIRFRVAEVLKGECAMRRPLIAVAGLAMIASATFAGVAGAADHRDSPLNVSNPTADINDVYAFRSREDPQNLVVAISANPLIVPTDNNTRGRFDNAVTFQVHVDTDGDLMDDATVDISKQGDNLIFEGLGDPIKAKITNPNQKPVINRAGPVKVFAGLRDDPFFFDLAGFQAFVANPQVPVNGLRPAGAGDPVDAFAGTNILAIVVELPITALTGENNSSTGVIKTWVSAERDGKRIDRMAIPAINTALIPSGMKDAFNAADPVNDATDFRPTANATIDTLRGVVDGLFGTPQDGGPLGNLSSQQVAGALIPDVVTIDFSSDVQFPNGRQLDDDVINAALGVVLNRGGAAGISDGVDGNDKPFDRQFPYLADPHTAAPGMSMGNGGMGSGNANAAASANGNWLTPPSTGDAGLMDSGTSWTLAAAFGVTGMVLASAAGVATVRSRGR
jgi:uncharacterized protein DUF4331